MSGPGVPEQMLVSALALQLPIRGQISSSLNVWIRGGVSITIMVYGLWPHRNPGVIPPVKVIDIFHELQTLSAAFVFSSCKSLKS